MADATIDKRIEQKYRTGKFIAPRKPGLVYMLSDHNYVFDPARQEVIHFPGHLMFYAPYLKASDIGSGPGAPFLTHPGKPDNLMVVVPASAHPH